MPYPRKDTISWLPGAYYHIYNRAINNVMLFREVDNFLYVLQKAKAYCREFDLVIIAYCLMRNHFHFLVQQLGEHPAGLLAQRIFNGYTKAYNHRYGHSGTLFERRFQVKHVDSDEYLLHLCRYIHANPVLAGYVDDPGGWPYSNYLDWILEREGSLVDRSFIRDYFASSADYQAFVMSYIRTGMAGKDAVLLAAMF